jgi:hypothetical protein
MTEASRKLVEESVANGRSMGQEKKSIYIADITFLCILGNQSWLNKTSLQAYKAAIL